MPLRMIKRLLWVTSWRNTHPATAYLYRLTVHVNFWQAGWLFRGSKRLKLTKVCKIGLLGDLLGGGGGEHSAASWCSLCLCAMPSVWCWCLHRQHSGGGRRFYCLNTMLLVIVMSFCFFSYLCGQRSGWHSRWVRYRRGLWLSWCRRGGEGAVHVERRGARVRGVGAGWRRRWGDHLKGLWRCTRLRPEHKTVHRCLLSKEWDLHVHKKYFPTIQIFNTVRITRLTPTFVSWLAPGLRQRSLNCCNHHLHYRQKCWVSILLKVSKTCSQ